MARALLLAALVAAGPVASVGVAQAESTGASAPWTVGVPLDHCTPPSPACAGRWSHSATRLADGRVLVAGGTVAGAALASSEIYDPVSQVWTATGSLHRARSDHEALLLPTGGVLVLGGVENGNVRGDDETAELFDPGATDSATGLRGSWRSVTPPTSNHGSGARATLLRDGKVLVTGGGGRTLGTAAADIYDPVADRWSSTTAMIHLRFEHSSVLLADGRVLVAGGWSLNFGPKLDSTEVWDEATGAWSPAGSLAYAPVRATLTALPGGEALIAGGGTGPSNGGRSTTSELFNPQTMSWTPTGPLVLPHDHHTATLLPTGSVLVTGGGPGDAASAELYEPRSRTWLPSSPPSSRRDRHTATLLSDGRVLVVGGMAREVLATTELYGVARPASAEGRPDPAGNRTTGGSASGRTALVLAAGAAAAGLVAVGGALAWRRRSRSGLPP